MHSIKIHKLIVVLMAFLYLTGIWHRGDKPTIREFKIKLFYGIYHFVGVLALGFGAILNKKLDQTVFLTEASVAVGVYSFKLWTLIWQQNQIQDLLNRVCEFSIRNDDDYRRYNEKLGRFMKFVAAYLLAVCVGSFESVVVPFLGHEKTLFFQVAFPLDYRNSEIAFLFAYAFVFTITVLTMIAVFVSVLIWYFLLNCSLRYEVLASELRNTGRVSETGREQVAIVSLRSNFSEDLKASVDTHVYLNELTNEVGSFCSDIFLFQLVTSAICICGSIYCLAFNIGDNYMERCLYLLLFIYVIAELLMITYFGNEIMLSSDRLSYSLFESDWYNQTQATKNCVIIFGEYLKQAQVLIIGKLYPLTLETFTKIVDSAYSMFNILKNFKQ